MGKGLRWIVLWDKRFIKEVINIMDRQTAAWREFGEEFRPSCPVVVPSILFIARGLGRRLKSFPFRPWLSVAGRNQGVDKFKNADDG